MATGGFLSATDKVRLNAAVVTTDTGTVSSTMITDNTIVNDDINSAAAIAGTKVNPDFGSQSVTTTGNISGSNVKGTDYIQLPTVSGMPPATDCDASDEYGRMKVDPDTSALYICTAAGWVSHDPMMPDQLIRFTRTALNSDATDEAKTSHCQSQFGGLYEAANSKEFGLYVEPMGIDIGGGATLSFSVAGHTNSVRLEVDAVNTHIMDLNSSGSVSTSRLACIYKYAPIRFTNTLVPSNSGPTPKDSECASKFGASYQGAGLIDVAQRMKGIDVNVDQSMTTRDTSFEVDIRNADHTYLFRTPNTGSYPAACRRLQ